MFTNLKSKALLFLVFAVSATLIFSGCKKPKSEFEKITISGNVVTVQFSDKVYGGDGGAVTEDAFTVSMTGTGIAYLNDWTVTHTAGSKNVTITLEIVDGDDTQYTLSVASVDGEILDEKDRELETFTKTEQFTAGAKPVITITGSADGVGTTTWTNDNIYLLQGFVYVNDGQTLTIEPGTLIKGKPGQEENASALIVARGGKIMAEGTAEQPIVFTAEADNYQGTGVAERERGLWGGLLILGKATTNQLTTDNAIEGIPTSETRGLYGGTNDADNSGTLRYVSIRHGGTNIGEANEINGLTLGAVGSGTTIEYIEVIANADDGIEWFGGTVNMKYIITSYCADDSYDWDQGFRGKGQFWCTIQDTAVAQGDNMGELDGGDEDETGEPYATPVIYNATFIGKGNTVGNRTLLFRDNSGGTFANSIFANQTKGIEIEYLEDDLGVMEGCSYKMWQDGHLVIKNNVFQDVADGTAAGIFKTGGDAAPQGLIDAWVADFTAQGNVAAAAGVTSANPVPATAITDNLATEPDSWYTDVNYKGAFGDTNWAAGWTLTFAE